ncbi:MAG: ferritin-like domain-containing protein [Roseiflexaceae bacterium]
MAIHDLNQKFAHELGDIYDAEHRFLEAQQQMLTKASSPQLKSMIQQHIQQTEQQIRNLEEIHNLLGQKPQRVTCEAAAGLVSEGQKTMKEAAGNPAILDCVIAGAQSKVEHYEVASCRGLVTGAQMMGQQQILQLLQQNLQQEEQTASLIEQSTPQLLQQAMSAQQRGA